MGRFALSVPLRLSRRSLLGLISFLVGGPDRSWSKGDNIKGSLEPEVSAHLRLSRCVRNSAVRTGMSPEAESMLASVGVAPTFPLVARPGQHYLEDAAGKPFLIHGDAAWSLIAQLPREKVDLYLDDRRARGFNTVLINLIEHRFSTNAPANAYGQQPFLTSGDYSTTNEKYFAHADWVLRQAADKGFLVLLAPSYTGFAGGPDGWYQEMKTNGPLRLREYGRYLGRRYRGFTNILWVEGGDYNPPDRDLVRAIAEGIREFNPQALHTAHCAPETSAREYWKEEPWLQVNGIYTYGAVFSAVVKEYARGESWPWSLDYEEGGLWRLLGHTPARPSMPFFLIESVYENEHDATGQRLRTDAYHAVLSRAAGQVFGNNPMWHFDGPGLYPAPVTWQEALGSQGSLGMTYLRELLARVSWWLLEADLTNSFLTSGIGSGFDRAVAARAADRSFAIVYLPSARRITLDLGQLAGSRVAARWYDPRNGLFSEAERSPFPTTGSQSFRPDAGTQDDRVLILSSEW